MASAGKSRHAFRTIAEVGEILGTEHHVLRYWESQFKQIKPVKRSGNRRLYRPADIELIAGLKRLLHEDKLTIKRTKRLLHEKGIKYVAGLGAEILESRNAFGIGPVDDGGTRTAAGDGEHAEAGIVAVPVQRAEAPAQPVVPADGGEVTVPAAGDDGELRELRDQLEQLKGRAEADIGRLRAILALASPGRS